MVLFAGYRRADANDPEGYVAAISAVLALYDPDIIREVTDPRTGISTSEKFRAFMPNSGELKAYCDDTAAHRERMLRLKDIPSPDFRQARLAPPETPRGALASVFVPEHHPRYASLVEWTKTAEEKYWKFGVSSDNRSGLWVSNDKWSGSDGRKMATN